jgi:hypothetical protein
MASFDIPVGMDLNRRPIECICDICLTKGIINGTMDVFQLCRCFFDDVNDPKYSENIEIKLIKKFSQLQFEHLRYERSKNNKIFNIKTYQDLGWAKLNTDPNVFKTIMVHIAMKNYKHQDFYDFDLFGEMEKFPYF